LFEKKFPSVVYISRAKTRTDAETATFHRQRFWGEGINQSVMNFMEWPKYLKHCWVHYRLYPRQRPHCSVEL